MADGRWSGRSRHRRGATRAPLALGWAPRETSAHGETVVAAFRRERLGEALATLHARGFGAAARVLDGSRGDLGGQVGRAGLPVDLVERIVAAGATAQTALLVVHTPARGRVVADLLRASGAEAIELITPPSAAEAVPPDALADLAGAEAGL